MSTEPGIPNQIVLNGIASMATRSLLAQLVAQYERETQQRVRVEAVGGVEAAKRVQNGEGFDFVLLASDAMKRLDEAGCLVAKTHVDVVRSSIALAVKAGASEPDVSSEAGVREAVLRAKTIGYSTGPSGTHVLRLLERWGVPNDAARVIQAPPGVPVGSMIENGTVEIGFQQLSELLPVEGITLPGVLPDPIQAVTTFVAAICAASAPSSRAAASAFLAYIASPATGAMKRASGMMPPD